jgi:hypothetical protein
MVYGVWQSTVTSAKFLIYSSYTKKNLKWRLKQMKKVIAVLLITILMIATSAGVFAQSEEKEVPVSITAERNEVKVGETIVLSAASLKHGSDYNDSWNGAEMMETVLEPETGLYVSKAEFVAEKPGIYTVTYSIMMTAGNSSVAFMGIATYTIEVIGAHEVTGAEIRDLSIRPITRPDGIISIYSAQGSIYVLWSDQTCTLYGSTFFNFRASETVKNIAITLNIEGEMYTYVVPVERKVQ